MKKLLLLLIAALTFGGSSLPAQDAAKSESADNAYARGIRSPRYVDMPSNSFGIGAGITKLILGAQPRPLFGENLEDADYPEGVWYFNADKELCANKDAVIWTKQKYSAYVCEFDFNLSEHTNGGFLIHCSDKDNWIPNTIEIQLLDDYGKEPDYHSCGSIYGFQAPKKNATRKPGEWNHMAVIVQGRLICVVLNDKVVNRIDLNEWVDNTTGPDGQQIEGKFHGRSLASFEPYGYIGFQGLHGNSPMRIRNAFIAPIANADTTTDGWKPFFGEKLENADYDPEVWSIDEEGVLHATKDEVIWGKGEYENFMLDFEYKAAKDANSGVVIQATDRGFWIPNSFEIQVFDSYGRDVDMSDCGAVYGRCAPAFNVCKAPGEWNHMTISVFGPDVYVILNDQLVTHMKKTQWTKYDENPDGTKPFEWLCATKRVPAETPNRGSVGFQGLHEKNPVVYRNVMIRTFGK